MAVLTKEDKKFIKLLEKIRRKSTCLRAKIGAIAVKNGKILLQTNNSFHKCYDCGKIGCIRDIQKIPSGMRREICYGLCAEQRMFAHAVKKGINLNGAILYLSSHPCRICESMIAESGIKKIIYTKGYPDVIPFYDTLRDFGIETIPVREADEKPREASTV